MQIDTFNRDAMNITGGKFVPGPMSKHSRSPYPKSKVSCCCAPPAAVPLLLLRRPCCAAVAAAPLLLLRRPCCAPAASSCG